MRVTKTYRPNLISDPDVAVVNDISIDFDDPYFNDTVITAREVALDALGNSVDSYHGWNYSYYPDTSQMVFIFYKE